MSMIAAACLLATDGDSIRNVCTGERYRLVVIDAPETGSCRPRGRVCVTGDGQAAKQSLARFLSGPVLIQRCGQDRYGRILVRASVNGHDAGQWQIGLGHALARYRDACVRFGRKL